MDGGEYSVTLLAVGATSENRTVVAVPNQPAASSVQRGMLYGLGCYISWGFVPLYFHALSAVPPVVILCHRILWSSLFLAAVVSVRREWRFILPVLRAPRNIIFLGAGSLLIAINWLVFIYAVDRHKVLQASFGYFVNPVFSIALGMIFLKERLRVWQWVAVVIAVLAVINLAMRETEFPWIAIGLAVSFGFYGLVRKKVNINSLHGLWVETVLLLPLALAALWLVPHPRTAPLTLGLLSLSGVITAVPLLMFGAALRLLKLSTMGFLQYVGPTLQFVVALVVFREVLDHAKLVSFGLTWIAIGVYVADSILTRHPPEVADEPE